NENRVWMRAYYATKSYNGDPNGNRMLNSLYNKEDEVLTPDVSLSETTRYLLEPHSARCFKFSYGWHGTYTWEEHNPREPFNSCMGNNTDYQVLGLKRLENTFLRYIDIDERLSAVCENYYYHPHTYWVPTARIMKYICEFVKYPIIESLMKSGFEQLVAAKVLNRQENKRYLNWEAVRLTDFFKTLKKPEIRILMNEDYQMRFLKAYSEMKKACGKADADMCRADLKHYGADKLMVLLSIVKEYKLNYTKAKNYLKKQNPEKESAGLQLWKDYLDMAKRLSYDLKNEVVLYPKSLQKAHDEVSATVSALIKEKQAEKMCELTKKLRKRYSFSWRGLEIVVPESMQEIIDEGKALEHCVGGYAERHAAGKLAILFIRKQSALDIPYVTMEVSGTTIRQFHGFKNDRETPLTQNVKDFVEEFKSYIKNPAAYKKNKAKEKKSA
ncbi:MAG: PcfJ domain-containing protein, partial [Ruminococcus sp.]|nr:PcfJ domain-containing protein [Ruminococcus sp.]